jgi:hypothetical protein
MDSGLCKLMISLGSSHLYLEILVCTVQPDEAPRAKKARRACNNMEAGPSSSTSAGVPLVELKQLLNECMEGALQCLLPTLAASVDKGFKEIQAALPGLMASALAATMQVRNWHACNIASFPPTQIWNIT